MINYLIKLFLVFLFLFTLSENHAMELPKKLTQTLLNYKLRTAIIKAQKDNFFGNWRKIKKYIDKGANPDYTEKNEKTLLSIAVENKCHDLINYLLQKGANINYSDMDGNTPLSLAMNNDTEIFKTLLKYTDINSQIKFVKPKYFTPFMCKLHTNKENIPNNHKIKSFNEVIYFTPLMYAINTSNKELTKYLLHHNADVNYVIGTNNPISLAIENSNEQILENLLTYNVDVNCKTEKMDGCTPLMLAAYLQREKILCYLLEHGADANACDNFGKTPIYALLSIASISKMREPGIDQAIFENLLNHRADPNAKPSENLKSPLALAASYGYSSLVESLIKFGADVNRKDYYGTPLAYALKGSDSETIKKFCVAGASLINITKDGDSAFHKAIACHLRKEDIHMLIAHASKSIDNQEDEQIKEKIRGIFLTFERLNNPKFDKSCEFPDPKLPWLPKEIQFHILFQLPSKYHFSVNKWLYKKLLPKNDYKYHYLPKLREQVDKQITTISEILQIKNNQNQTALDILNIQNNQHYKNQIQPLFNGIQLQKDLEIFHATPSENIKIIPTDNLALQMHQDLITTSPK